MKYKIKDSKGKVLPHAFLRQNGKIYDRDNSLLISDDVEVKGATIHFCTGYKDCNGVDLFEGDIVIGKSSDGYESEALVRIEKDMGVVLDTGKGIYPFKHAINKLTLKEQK